MNRKLTSLALASAGLLAIALPGVSHAYVMASSMINMTNFTISDAGGRLDASDFVPGSLTYTISANQSATLNGVTVGNTTFGVTAVDFAPVCVGGGCAGFGLTDNSFPEPVAPPTAGNYAAADQLDVGSPITGTPLGNDPSHVAIGAYTGLDTGTAVSSVEANNNFNAEFTFVLAQAGGITFSFDLDAWLQVAMSGDELFPATATAAYSMDFTLSDSNGDEVFFYSPLTGGATASLVGRFVPGADRQTIRNASDGAFSSTSVALLAGEAYTASFRMTTEVDAARVERVPEPGVLALLGLGLVGLGLSRRRKASV